MQIDSEIDKESGIDRSSYKQASELDPCNFEANCLLKEYEELYEEIHPKKE